MKVTLKQISLVLGILVITIPAGVTAYNHFAKTSQMIVVTIRQDKGDLRWVQGQIWQLELTAEKRKLTPLERKRLQELKQQERDIIRQIQYQEQQKKGWW